MEKHTPDETQVEGELSKTERDHWDHILKTLGEYFETPGGTEFYDRFISLMTEINQRQQSASAPILPISLHEERAFRFITKELKNGRSPSVREIAKAIGCRSSRTGMRAVNGLFEKGLVWRDESGRLATSLTCA